MHIGTLVHAFAQHAITPFSRFIMDTKNAHLCDKSLFSTVSNIRLEQIKWIFLCINDIKRAHWSYSLLLWKGGGGVSLQ